MATFVVLLLFFSAASAVATGVHISRKRRQRRAGLPPGAAPPKPAGLEGGKAPAKGGGGGPARRLAEKEAEAALEGSRKSCAKLLWFGWGQGVHVRDYYLPGGLIYIGTPPRSDNGEGSEPSMVDADLPVSQGEPWQFGGRGGAVQPYAGLSPASRGAYLKWLATGRRLPQADTGCPLLFLCGLERRMFVDGAAAELPKGEAEAIVREAEDLLSVYKNDGSFCRQAGRFAVMARILGYKLLITPENIDYSRKFGTEFMRYALAVKAQTKEPVSPQMALSWLGEHPDYGLRTPARRCPREFLELFSLKIKAEFKIKGVIVKPDKSRLQLQYKYANPSLGGHFTFSRPDLSDPFNNINYLNALNKIALKCASELEPYSRLLGRKGARPDSIAAASLLPGEILGTSIFAESARSFLSKQAAGGLALTPVKSLCDFLGVSHQEPLSRKSSQKAAAFVEKLGFGVIPDARHYMEKLDVGGACVIFPQGHGPGFKRSDAVMAAGLVVRLGSIISQSDGKVSPREKELLHDFIASSPALAEREKKALSALLFWLLHTPHSVGGLKHKLAVLDSEAKSSLCRIMLAVAVADGRTEPAEVKALEKAYAALGLDKSAVAGDLSGFSARFGSGAEQLDTQPTERVLLQKAAAGGGAVLLNDELVTMTERETEQVQNLLNQIFAGGEEDAPEDPAGGEGEPCAGLPGLDPAHQALLAELSAQSHWERPKFNAVCERLRLLPDGAMEVINEWAYARASAPLIEDGEPIFFDAELAGEIRGGGS
jgi:tellurite resistance protein